MSPLVVAMVYDILEVEIIISFWSPDLFYLDKSIFSQVSFRGDFPVFTPRACTLAQGHCKSSWMTLRVIVLY